MELEALWNRPIFNTFEEHVPAGAFEVPILRHPIDSSTIMISLSTTIKLMEVFEDRIKTRRVPRSMIQASVRLDNTGFNKYKNFTSDDQVYTRSGLYLD